MLISTYFRSSNLKCFELSLVHKNEINPCILAELSPEESEDVLFKEVGIYFLCFCFHIIHNAIMDYVKAYVFPRILVKAYEGLLLEGLIGFFLIRLC